MLEMFVEVWRTYELLKKNTFAQFATFQSAVNPSPFSVFLVTRTFSTPSEFGGFFSMIGFGKMADFEAEKTFKISDWTWDNQSSIKTLFSGDEAVRIYIYVSWKDAAAVFLNRQCWPVYSSFGVVTSSH